MTKESKHSDVGIERQQGRKGPRLKQGGAPPFRASADRYPLREFLSIRKSIMKQATCHVFYAPECEGIAQIK